MEVLTIIALIVGPIAAVQVQKYLERLREKKNTELNIFRTLMATRGSRLSRQHVEALNLIDLVFRNKKQRTIIEAWRIYLDHLENYPDEKSSEDQRATWDENSIDLLVDLIYEISKYLKYNFDKVQLKRGIYVPKGHTDLEIDQLLLRKGLLDVFVQKKPLRIKIDNE